MKIPRFTAEASLYKTDEYNHGVLIAPIDSMQVLPQLQVDGCTLVCYPPPWGCEWICGTGGHDIM